MHLVPFNCSAVGGSKVGQCVRSILGFHEKVQMMLILDSGTIFVGASADLKRLLSSTQMTFLHHQRIHVATGAESLEMCWERL